MFNKATVTGSTPQRSRRLLQLVAAERGSAVRRGKTHRHASRAPWESPSRGADPGELRNPGRRSPAARAVRDAADALARHLLSGHCPAAHFN